MQEYGVFDHCGSRQTDMQVRPPGSSLAEIKKRSKIVAEDFAQLFCI